MLLTLIISMTLALTSTLFLSSAPLLLGAWIMAISLLMSLSISLHCSSWISLMMFLIYIGGLLVMFAYFVALTPNLFIESKTMFLSSFTTFALLTLMTSFSQPSHMKTFSSFSQSPMMNLMLENMFAIMFMALILFFALVAVVKLCSSHSAPLRPFK